MDIARIDYWASTGESPIHRSSLLSKVLATASVIACVVLSRDLIFLVSLYLFVVIAVRSARLPMLPVLGLSLFPAFFSVLYALSLAKSGWALPVVVVMKAVTAATSMILLVSTTPYAEVIGFFGRALPTVVRDGLFMTYRSFFILMDLTGNLLMALRLRGGFGPRRVIRNAGNISSGLGMAFIQAYEKSQRLYDVMSIRGYSGKLGSRRPLGGLSLGDLPFLLAAVAFLILAAYSRITGRAAHAALPALLIACAISMEALRAWKR